MAGKLVDGRGTSLPKSSPLTERTFSRLLLVLLFPVTLGLSDYQLLGGLNKWSYEHVPDRYVFHASPFQMGHRVNIEMGWDEIFGWFH